MCDGLTENCPFGYDALNDRAITVEDASDILLILGGGMTDYDLYCHLGEERYYELIGRLEEICNTATARATTAPDTSGAGSRDE